MPEENFILSSLHHQILLNNRVMPLERGIPLHKAMAKKKKKKNHFLGVIPNGYIMGGKKKKEKRDNVF
jgi:hypothetical protein